MSKFANQTSDAENAKSAPKSVDRTHDLTTTVSKPVQAVASEDPRDTQDGNRGATA